MPNEMNAQEEKRKKILQLMQEALRQDQTLRDEHHIGEKFRFIRDRLNALMTRVEENLSTIKSETEKKVLELLPDEMFVYVYLFNAQGLVLKTWQKIITPSVFYEYSINRPIYADQSAVEAFIRLKTNRAQHGYLTVAIKKTDVVELPAGQEPTKDVLDHIVLKIKEGSLRFDRLFYFTHNNINYVLNQAGELVQVA